MLLKSILWTCFTISTAIKVPSSWKDEQTFLPYYVVVDGLPSAQNVETYYPENAASDQVVQNDVVVKLFQKMNPNLAILKPQQPLENPPKKLPQKPVLIDKSFTHVAQEKRQEDDGESENNHEEAAENLGVKTGGVDHENPGDIPTKPIYPGEGQWARKGLKHRPHISKNLLPKKEEKEEGPDTAGTDFYNAQKDKFQKDFDEFPKKHNLYQPRRQTKKNEDFEEKAASEDFEPYRTYAQVRKTITKKRLPKKKKTDPRLRESIKDSKIHTVYSEEGYEDSAYDHGDQEKQAESREKEKGADPENFPEPPPPPSEDEESLEVDEESDKPKDEKESESKSESVVEPKEAPTDQEGHLIDSMMDESKYGKKTAKPKFIIKVRRKRRSTEELDPKKYPHYTSTKVNSLSSLRYVENPSNIPKKGAMSFYKEADKMECPEVMDVDPIPDKIKDGANHTDESNSTITTPKPKLDKLGDQIDCFKTRYFGEDPLDNPLFKEEAVDTPNRSFLNDGSDEENLIEDRESKDLTDENLPEPQPYILVKRIYRRPQRKKAKRTKKRPPPPKFDQHPSSSNSERISEVHYKDEINPSEQMNVFADIINNIKNSSRDSGLESSEIQPVTIRVLKKPPSRNPPAKRSKFRPTTKAPAIFAEIYEDLDQIHQLSSPAPHPYYTQSNSNEIPIRRYKKRKRRPIQASTQPIHESTTEYIKVKKRRIKPEYTSTHDLNIPPIINGFKPMTDIPQNNHKPQYEEIETATTNKFLVVGMRPPPETPYVHSNFYLNNQIKLKRRNQPPTLRKRYVRSTSRRGYADIQRDSKGGQTVPVRTDQEEDDYTPHRSRNFHYDEKLGKIVYDKKPQEEEEAPNRQEEIEYEYIEIEEPTHPPPAKKKEEPKRVWPSQFPDGPNYLDFIKKLKENPNYVEILDPKSTEKPAETTPTPTKTIGGDKDAIPEFLAILTKVKGDKNYKIIEDTTLKPKTTAPLILEEFEEEIGDVQNAPGAQSSDLAKSPELIDGDQDSGSKSKNYNPRTGVDTSKYTSIQRPVNTRHSISSRYKSDPPDLEQVETGELESVPTTITESFTINIPTTSIPPTTPFKATTTSRIATTATTSTTTAKTRRVVPNRRRGTTTPAPNRTSEGTTQTGRRLNRGRNRFRSSTTEASTEESTRSRRNLSRRSQANLAVPKNHKEHYTEAQTVSNLRGVKPTPRSISLELLKQSDLNSDSTKTNQTNATNLGDVEVFKDYDKDKKHGGNYKYKKVQIKVTRNYNPASEGAKSQDIDDINSAKYYDIVPKPFTYYSDTKLPLRINELKEKSDDGDVTIFEEDDRRIYAEDDDNFRESRELGAQTRIPNFIKDPSKRLYYYAPI